MRVHALVLALLAAFGLLVAWLYLQDQPSTTGSEAPVQTVPDTPGPGVLQGDDGPGPAAAARSGTDGDRDRIATRLPQLTGRCIDAAGRGIAGCTLEVSWKGGERSGQSGSDGGFELALPRTGERRRLHLSHPGYASVAAYLPAPRQDLIALGDIRLPKGPRLLGVVLDEKGQPVPDAVLDLQWTGAPDGPFRPAGAPGLRSGPDGRLPDLQHRLASGSWSAFARPPLRLLQPTLLVLRAQEEERRVEFRVRVPPPEDMILGEVVDADQAHPVLCSVYGKSARGEQVAWASTYKREGRFCLVRPESATRDPVHIHVQSHGFKRHRSATPIPWGTRGLKIRLERGDSLGIRVLRADDRKPVTEYRAFWFTERKTGDTGWARGAARGTRHAGGEALLEAVPAGEGFVHVVPNSRQLCPTDPVRYRQPSSAPLEILVQPAEEMPVRLVGTDGVALVGSKVQLVRQRGADLPNLSGRLIRPFGWQILGLNRGQTLHLLADEQTSDAEGRLRLRWYDQAEAHFFLIIKGPEHRPRIESVRWQTDELELRLDRGGRVAGRVAPREVLQALRRHQAGIELALTPLGIEAANPHAVEVAADGSFDKGGLAAGRWQLELIAKAGRHRKEAYRVRHPGDLEVRAGDTQEVLLSLQNELPARLEGRVRIDGAPAGRYQLQLDGSTRSFSWATDAGGNYHIPLINPGSYRVSVTRLGAKTATARIYLPQQLQVAPGAELRRDFGFRTASLQLTVVDQAGEAQRLQAFELRPPGGSRPIYLSTDAQGIATLPRLGVGSYDIYRRRAQAGNDPVKLGSVRIEAGDNRRQLRVDTAR